MTLTHKKYKLPLNTPARAVRCLVLLFTLAAATACGNSTAPVEPPPPSDGSGPSIATELPTQIAAPATTPQQGNQPPTPPPTSGIPPDSAPVTSTVAGTVVVTRPANLAEIQITVTEISQDVSVETVVQNLEVPWAIAFAPDGRIFVTERPGRIRVIRDGNLRREAFAVLDQVVSISESGLMGIAVHPDFADNHYLYVCYTYQSRRGELRNRVARLTDVDGVGKDHQIILDDIPGSRNHNGCRIAFGPDRKLYVTTGDAQDRDRAQDLDSLAGKVLRLDADGSIPQDNPFIASYVYTFGHRNPQGLDWHPATGDLFITEHGPDRNDEINILEPGRNYGWPAVTGRARSDEFVGALVAFTPTLAIAGAAFYSGDILHPSWQGSLVFATLKGSQLRRLVLSPPTFQSIESSQVLVDRDYGRLRAVAVSPQGYLYFTTSNRDGRGQRRPGDDQLLRLAPVPAGPPRTYHPDETGKFELALEPGTYHLRWEGDGFAPQETQLTIADNQSVNLGRIVLEP